MVLQKYKIDVIIDLVFIIFGPVLKHLKILIDTKLFRY